MEETGTGREHARAAGLKYVSGREKGFRREKKGREFVFRNPRGRVINDAATLGRIRRLAIPPAWTEVWICRDPDGHLQATGRDDRGRKQYRYHRRWREVRDETKFNRMLDFARVLPKIRQRTARDLKEPGLSRHKALAAVVRILETGLVRVGNEEYARVNNSYGLTTMRDRHVKVRGGAIRFEFSGKGGKPHRIELTDARLARIVKKCQDLPGQELFQYLDDSGRRQRITSNDVNDYLREITRGDFTAKDFRTWAGTVLAAVALREVENFDSQAQAKRNIVSAIESVALRLGNTPAICKKCYVHPFIFDAYLDGSLLIQAAAQRSRGSNRGLNADERMVLKLLRRRLAAEAKRSRGGLLKQLQESLKHRKKAGRWPKRPNQS